MPRSRISIIKVALLLTVLYATYAQAQELPANVWARPSVHSASNCAACHKGAGQGDFEEDDARIPG